ncbi:MAG: SMC-Scp complex subunit ScpB [Spirochaetales bacterium]|nr:SMC-Scp complex subunit ScpB [Spirochaetales bacterium]
MELENETALVEAVLFLESDPVELSKLKRITGLSGEVIKKSIEALRLRLEKSGSGLEVTELAGGYLLSPKAELWEQLKNTYGKRRENRLSRAAMETLSIIAYSQPITKAEIESIRGVSADTMLRLLQERELISQVGKKDIPGKPPLYGTTRKFLETFGLSSISDLPKLSDLDREKFELEGS